MICIVLLVFAVGLWGCSLSMENKIFRCLHFVLFIYVPILVTLIYFAQVPIADGIEESIMITLGLKLKNTTKVWEYIYLFIV